MEYLGAIVILITPIYLILFKIQGRLTKVETKVSFLFEKNGGEDQ